MEIKPAFLSIYFGFLQHLLEFQGALVHRSLPANKAIFMYHPALFIHIHRKLYQGVRSKKCNITLNPLGPTGPGRPDIMDPSAEMTNPGSPFSPCVYTQVHLKKKKSNFLIVFIIVSIQKTNHVVCTSHLL